MPSPFAFLGLDVASFIRDAIKALVDLVVPDIGADWASRVVTWLVALPDITGPAFPALNAYARDLTAVGFGLLGATTAAGLLQLWAGGLTGAARPAEAIRRSAIAAAVLVSYPTVIHTIMIATNTLTAAMIRHPGVQDGLDKAFGEALVAAVITSGVSLGLAVGAAFTLLYFLAALFVLKIGLTAALAVLTIAGALVWGLYPLPHTSWLAQAWVAALVAAITVPVAWACIFAAAALLASDTLVFEGTSSYNNGLGSDLASLVKPFAAVACFWLAYRAPGMLLGVARAAGVAPLVGGRGMTPGGQTGGGGASSPAGPGPGLRPGRSPEALVNRGLQTNADRFRALGTRATTSTRSLAGRVRPTTPSAPTTGSPSHGGATSPKPTPAPWRARATRLATAPKRGNDAWRALPEHGRRARAGVTTPPRPQSSPTSPPARPPQRHPGGSPRPTPTPTPARPDPTRSTPTRPAAGRPTPTRPTPPPAAPTRAHRRPRKPRTKPGG